MIPDIYRKFIDECRQELSTDSRQVIPGSLFIAWKGENDDGNKYAQAALEAGCRYAIIDNPQYAFDDRYILVSDGIKTLQELSAYHREQFNIPVIAIGGSNGKTTTKELARGVLQTEKRVVASFGSENNHVGVPKTLFRITKETEIALVEIGANHLGEIKDLCEIVKPSHGLITNVGRDHIGFFGGADAILKANLELYEYLKEHNGVIFVNKDDSILTQHLPEGSEVFFYGTSVGKEYAIFSEQTSPFFSYQWKQYTNTTQITGEYNLSNVAAATVLGIYFGIQDQNILKGIAEYAPTTNRSRVIETERGNIVIKDFYNANRTSMEHALDNLGDIKKRYPNKKTLAILGDMFELGDFSDEEHGAVIRKAEEIGIDELLLVGYEFSKTKPKIAQKVSDTDKAIEYLQKQNFENSIILLKASNAMNFQKLFEEVVW